jgi:hypothetical protein
LQKREDTGKTAFARGGIVLLSGDKIPALQENINPATDFFWAFTLFILRPVFAAAGPTRKTTDCNLNTLNPLSEPMKTRI